MCFEQQAPAWKNVVLDEKKGKCFQAFCEGLLIALALEKC